jgi:twinkle protein
MNIIPDSIDFAAYMAQTMHKANVIPAAHFLDDLQKTFVKKDKKTKIYLPWYKTRNEFDFRAGELTVWAGANGHGKSLVTTQMFMSLLGQEQKVCVASLEMPVIKTNLRMLRMYSHYNPEESEDYPFSDNQRAMFSEASAEMAGWYERNLWFFAKTGNFDPDVILGMVRYCATELGIQHVIVDNLQKCIRGTDDYNAEKDFVSDLFDAAKETGCHVHLVHHTKKMDKEESMPDKNDIKGSSSITDIVDNVFLVWRNKAKENEIKLKGQLIKQKDAPDSYLNCVKQRHYSGNDNGEPMIGLFFDKQSTQFKGDETAPLMDFYKKWPHVN